MDPVRNPFAPGAGTPPPELAGRSAILERASVTLARIKQGRAAKSLLLIGLRGVGKTVLLNRILQLAEDAGYKTALIKKGMIYSPQHGDTAFTVPLFNEFMRRQMPL